MQGSRGQVQSLLRTVLESGTVAGLSDARLVRRVALRAGASSELAFTALVERHGPMVLRVCRRVLRDPHEANDAFQATFLVFARRAGSIRKPQCVASWLHGVAIRAAHTLLANAKRRRFHEQQAAARAGQTAEVDDCSADWIAVIHEEIARLSARERAVVVMCDLEGVTYSEAAQRLGCPIGTIKSRLAGARRRLRARLLRRGVAPAAGAIGAALTADCSASVPLLLQEQTIQAASRFALDCSVKTLGTVPRSVLTLAQGVIQSMMLTKLKAMVLVATAFVVTGAVVWAQAESYRFAAGEQQPPAAEGDRLRSLERKLDRVLEALERVAGPRPGVGAAAGAAYQEAAKVTEEKAKIAFDTAYGVARNIAAAQASESGIEARLRSIESRLDRLEAAVFDAKRPPSEPRAKTSADVYYHEKKDLPVFRPQGPQGEAIKATTDPFFEKKEASAFPGARDESKDR